MNSFFHFNHANNHTNNQGTNNNTNNHHHPKYRYYSWRPSDTWFRVTPSQRPAPAVVARSFSAPSSILSLSSSPQSSSSRSPSSSSSLSSFSSSSRYHPRSKIGSRSNFSIFPPSSSSSISPVSFTRGGHELGHLDPIVDFNSRFVSGFADVPSFLSEVGNSPFGLNTAASPSSSDPGLDAALRTSASYGYILQEASVDHGDDMDHSFHGTSSSDDADYSLFDGNSPSSNHWDPQHQFGSSQMHDEGDSMDRMIGNAGNVGHSPKKDSLLPLGVLVGCAVVAVGAFGLYHWMSKN